jgi:carboxyl-terminal processing protease
MPPPVAVALCIAVALQVQPPVRPNEQVFGEAMRITASAFYDPRMNGIDWGAVEREFLPRAAAARNTGELSAVINEALSRLNASHMAHYTQDQREYYEVLDIFHPDGVAARPGSRIRTGAVHYTGIGLAATTIKGRRFALDVYSGGPADKAGVLPGDELISVTGIDGEEMPWGDVAPFRDRAGASAKITIQRTESADSRRQVTVVPTLIRPRDLFLDSITAGAKVLDAAGKKVGYVRIRSYAHPSYHEKLKDLLRTDFKDADSLILDLRGGWGGASPQYMDIFNPTAPVLTHQRRDGEPTTVEAAWHKPVVMLIDSGTRSGKELLAYAFKKHKVGVLVGERTAGAVLGGSPRPLSDGSLLLIAVTDVRVDGEKLEGVGVSPDIEVRRDLPYSAGKDPQIEAAVRVLTK